MKWLTGHDDDPTMQQRRKLQHGVRRAEGGSPALPQADAGGARRRQSGESGRRDIGASLTGPKPAVRASRRLSVTSAAYVSEEEEDRTGMGGGRDVSIVAYRRTPVFDSAASEEDASFDPYAVLGVSRQAKLKEVKDAYRELALRYHPDRICAAARLSLRGVDAAVAFSRINEAYAVLVDEYKRTRFLAMESLLEADIEKLAAVKRKNAMLDITLMHEALKENIAREWHRNGVIIVRALYGEMPEVVDVYRTLADQAFGEVIDVTKPVQHLVCDSKLVVPAGTSKVTLKGFYDPVNGYPKVLAIRYLFRRRLHQVVVNDFGRIRIPMRGHLMPADCQDLAMQEMDATAFPPPPPSAGMSASKPPAASPAARAASSRRLFATPTSTKRPRAKKVAQPPSSPAKLPRALARSLRTPRSNLWRRGPGGTLVPTTSSTTTNGLEDRLRGNDDDSTGSLVVGGALLAAVVSLAVARPDLLRSLAQHSRTHVRRLLDAFRRE